MNKEELIKKIEKAFELEQYPGDLKIVSDNTGYDLDSAHTAKVFKGLQWNKLHKNVLFEERDSLFFFSKEGFKYFLPAFMIAVVNDFQGMDNTPEILIREFTLPSEIDTVLLANKIKEYRLDKQIPQIDFNEYLQNSLKGMNNDIHDFIAMAEQFNPQQGEVIKNFLEFLNQYNSDLYVDPMIAIERYWFQY